MGLKNFSHKIIILSGLIGKFHINFTVDNVFFRSSFQQKGKKRIQSVPTYDKEII